MRFVRTIFGWYPRFKIALVHTTRYSTLCFCCITHNVFVCILFGVGLGDGLGWVHFSWERVEHVVNSIISNGFSSLIVVGICFGWVTSSTIECSLDYP